MQPFPVICETCHARLKVRSDSVIGHILACPKCGSMVEIVPPAGWSAAEADSQSPAPEAMAEPQLSKIAWLTGPIALWTSGGAAVVLATTLVGALWLRGDAGPGEPIEAPASAVDATVASLDNASQGTPIVKAAEVEVVQPEPSAETVETARSEASQPALDEASIAETVTAITGPPPVATAPDSKAQLPAAKREPLDAAPARLTLDPQPESEPSPAPARTSPHNVHYSGLSPRSSLVDPTAAVRLGPMSSESPRSRDLARQLALPIQSLELTRVPLDRLIDMLSDMAAVPITLDPAALSMAGLAANEEVSVEARDTTVAELLGDILAKHGLACEEQNGQLVVVKPNVDRRRSVDYQLKDLVLADEADAAPLAALIRRLVAPDTWKAAGGAGEIEVDGSTLRVDQIERVHYQVLAFCERLRLARDLPLRSRYPAELLTIAPLYRQLESRLGRSTTFTFLPWAQLNDVFRLWQDASGVTVLVDWPALAEQELGPATPVACSIVDRPWHEALDTILPPVGLSWWAVDAETIQITSGDAANRLQQIEFYPVAKRVLDEHVSTAAFTAAVERELNRQFADAAPDSQRYQIAFDASSGQLVVLGSPDVQRYLSSRLDSMYHEVSKDTEEE